jgi:hypothetical protein
MFSGTPSSSAAPKAIPAASSAASYTLSIPPPPPMPSMAAPPPQSYGDASSEGSASSEGMLETSAIGRAVSQAQPSATNATVPSAPTVEAFARIQSFEGSFDDASWLPQGLLKQSTLPPIPASLDALASSVEVKAAIWRTLLCVAFLETKFTGEKEVWDVMVEKALDYARQGLEADSGVSDVEELLRTARQEAVSAIV